MPVLDFGLCSLLHITGHVGGTLHCARVGSVQEFFGVITRTRGGRRWILLVEFSLFRVCHGELINYQMVACNEGFDFDLRLIHVVTGRGQ